MNQSLNQFCLKGGLADRAFGMNIKFEKKSLRASEKERYAIFFSRGFDSGESNMTWNRLFIHMNHPVVMTYLIYARASNDTKFFYQDHFYLAEDFLNKEDMDAKEKLNFFSEENGGICFTNCNDILLYRLEGRYLWIAIEFFYDLGSPPIVDDLWIEFPMQNFIQYLPEIYQDNYDFTSRFLAVPGVELMDLNEKIDQFEKHLDLSTAKKENLLYLSTWIGAQEKVNLIGQNKMREFLKKAVYFSSIKGTPKCIREVVEFLVEGKVKIAEYHNYKNCYTDDKQKTEFLQEVLKTENTFAVILMENAFSSGATKGQVMLFLQYYKPVLTKPVILYEIQSKTKEGESFLSLELGMGALPKAILDTGGSGKVGFTVMDCLSEI